MSPWHERRASPRMWWLRRSSRLDRLFALVNCASCCTAHSPARPFLLDKSSNSADRVGCAATRRACIFVDICKRFVRSSKQVCFVTLASCPPSRSAHGRASADSATICNERQSVIASPSFTSCKQLVHKKLRMSRTFAEFGPNSGHKHAIRIRATNIQRISARAGPASSSR
jgi:hypothetical protein